MLATTSKVTLNNPEVAVLLSPIRDRDYLKSLVNPTTTAPDAGLGVIDNVFFFVAGHYPGGITSPNAPEDRIYLFWFGSPAGTTAANPKYSIFYAKVHPEKYRPNAPASEWLDPPVLLLSYDQLSRDIINWFDNMMNNAGIGVSSPGVSNGITPGTYINGYGYAGYAGNPNPIIINMTGTPELKQLHLIYDMIDDTVLMYLSAVTPNWNPATKSQFVYKFPVSLLKSNQSINQYAVSGLTSTTTSTPPPNDKPYFLGGLKFDDTIEQLIGGAFGHVLLHAFPQFSIAFDYYESGSFYGYKPSNGYLPAIYVENAKLVVYPNFQEGNSLLAILLADIHKNPAQPMTYYQLMPAPFGGNTNYNIPILGLQNQLDSVNWGLAIGKFGPILPGESLGIQGVYAVPVAVPATTELSGILGLRMKMLYIAPIFDQLQGYGGLAFAWTKNSVEIPYSPYIGISTPYVTLLPDNKLKVIMGGHYSDDYVDGIAVYVDKDVLSPRGKTLVTVTSIIAGQAQDGSYYLIGADTNGVVTYNFGKKYARILLNGGAGNAVPVRSYV